MYALRLLDEVIPIWQYVSSITNTQWVDNLGDIFRKRPNHSSWPAENYSYSHILKCINSPFSASLIQTEFKWFSPQGLKIKLDHRTQTLTTLDLNVQCHSSTRVQRYLCCPQLRDDSPAIQEGSGPLKVYVGVKHDTKCISCYQKRSSYHSH